MKDIRLVKAQKTQTPMAKITLFAQILQYLPKEDIRKSVNSQMLTVFLIPIILACIHLAVVLPIVNKLLMLFGLFDIPRLIITSSVCVLICGIVYAVIYRVTSNAYYRIVS